MSDKDQPSIGRASPQSRKPYEKPVVRRFSLKAEEVLVDGCKTISGGVGFTGPGCAYGGCFAQGS